MGFLFAVFWGPSQNKCSHWIVCDDLGFSAGQASGSLTPAILGTRLWESKRCIQWGQTLAPPTLPPPWWDLFSFTGVQSLQSLDPYSDRRVGWFLGSGEGQAAPSSHCLGGSTWVPPLQGTSFGGWPLSLQGLKISSLISFLYLTMHGLCH